MKVPRIRPYWMSQDPNTSFFFDKKAYENAEFLS